MSSMFYDGGPAASGQKVCLATTAYDSPDASYTYSIQKSRQALASAGIQSAYLLLSGNCHVDDARNVVVQEFLLSDCTDLVFLDADVSWEPADLVKLCCYDCDLVGGVYPYRRQGFNSNMPVRMIPGRYEPQANGLLEVEGLPAGFMRIRRTVLERLSAQAHHYRNRGDRRSEVPILFERTYGNGTRMGGDITFCAKWKALGGEAYAAADLRLGHAAKAVVRDSLSAALRRQADATLSYVADRIRAGSEDINLIREAREYAHNPYSALEDVLSLAMLLARKADGPILETGSGLSTIIMAAANPDQRVYCIEHDPGWAAQLEAMAWKARTFNISIVTAPIRDGWYAIDDELPERFALGLNDGPPRQFGSRMGFFEHFGKRCDVIIADDADDFGYAEAIKEWAANHGRPIDFIPERAALIRRIEKEKEAA